MKTYDIIATFNFEIPANFARYAQWSSDEGGYTEVDNAQTVRVSVPANMAGGFEQALNADSNVIEYAESGELSLEW